MPDTQTPAVPLDGGDGSRARYRTYVLWILFAVYAVNFIDRQIIAILSEQIKADLALSDTQIGLLTGLSFAIFYATFGIPLATIADRGNRRNMIGISVIAYSVMTAACGLATNFAQLLLARIGVAIGEAGSSPPSHTIIADLFPPQQLATAMGIFALGMNAGLAAGYLFGGLLGGSLGWRMTLVAFAVPGIVLGVLVLTTIREPGRRHNRPAEGLAPVALNAVILFILGQRSLWLMMLAVSFLSMAGYALMAWMPAFLQRSHGLSLAQAGTFLSVTIGVLGAVGTYAGGRMTDMLARRDEKWLFLLLALVFSGSWPFTVSTFLVSSPALSFAFWCVPAFFSGFHMGATLSAAQRLVPPSMRARMSAILLLLISLIGIGIGPVVVGLGSDLLAPAFGAKSLQASLAAITVAFPVAALLFFVASKSVQADLDSLTDGAAMTGEKRG